MKNIFRVLLIDDTKEVLENLQAIIKEPIVVKNFSNTIVTAQVEVETLHVVMEKLHGGENYRISDETIDNLNVMCDKDFDFIFSDFAFVGDRTKNDQLRATLLQKNQGVDESDISGWILHLRDIKKRIDEAAANTPEKYNRLNSRFLQYKNIINVYTNSPEPFSNYFNSFEKPKRIVEIQKVFPNSKSVELILMHEEFLINHQIDSIFANPLERRKFYAQLLSKKLKALIVERILESIVINQRIYQYRTAREGRAKLIRVGIILGAFSALMGEVIFHFFEVPFEVIKEHFFKGNVYSDFEKVCTSLLLAVSLLVVSYFLLQKFAVYLDKKTQDFGSEMTNIND